MKMWLFSLRKFPETQWALAEREIVHLVTHATEFGVPGATGVFRSGILFEERFVPVAWRGPIHVVHAMVAVQTGQGREEFFLSMDDPPRLMDTEEPSEDLGSEVLSQESRMWARGALRHNQKVVAFLNLDAMVTAAKSP